MEDPPLSKNKLKKLKREQEWEENRAQRKSIRKEKIKAKKQRKQAAQKEAITTGPNLDTSTVNNDAVDKNGPEVNRRRYRDSVQLPVTIVLDCGFEEYMNDKEKKSLASQVTRCYSDNHKAPFRTHLTISSFGGHLKERFDDVLSGHHTSWKGVRFLEDDFVEVAKQAKEWMNGDPGGKLAGAFTHRKATEPKPSEEQIELGEVVYLTSDSPDTLTELKPYSTYIVGGIVDRNRHKGICYKRAMDRGLKTAKLPIGDYMRMASRFVLATNHVSEIMVRWLEFGDWGEAFSRVVPKRKGGVLKSTAEGAGWDVGAATTDAVEGDGEAELVEEAQDEPGNHAKPVTSDDEVRDEKLD